MDKRVAVVTGASKGIGKAIALALVNQGFFVVGCARKSPAKGLPFELKIADVTKLSDTKRLVKYVKNKHGRLDVLVNTVGEVKETGSFLEISDEEWLSCYRSNVLSAVWMTREAFPLLKKSSCARVINIGSLSASIPGLFLPHYSAAKAGIVNLTKHMSDALASHGILVNSVSPGPVENGVWKKATAAKRRQIEQVPLGRLGSPEEVAEVVAFLASERASWTTGSNFRLDGGKPRFIF